MKKQTIIISIGILILIVFLFYNITGRIIKTEPGEYDNFARCLTEKGAKMYGTDWCHYCKDQKKLFGKSFKYVDYINCDYNKDKCNIEGIRGYPTWKINGEIYSGVQSLERLSSLTGCEL